MYLVINNSGYHSFDDLKSMVAAIRTVISLYPQEYREKVRHGVHELIINAVEHGVLKLGLREKYRLKRKGPLPYQNHIEENLKTNIGGIIMVSYEETKEKITLTISDGGDGFDWKRMGNKEIGTDGTGLLVAKGSFDQITYNKMGNVVTSVLRKNTCRSLPPLIQLSLREFIRQFFWISPWRSHEQLPFVPRNIQTRNQFRVYFCNAVIP